MTDHRDRAHVRPLGTNPALQLTALPDWHPYRQRYEFVAEIAWGRDALSIMDWSWLMRNRITGLFMELPLDARAARSVPQDKVTAALAAMREQA